MKDRPRLVVFAGLPGSGKSTLAQLIAERLGAVWLRVDTLEASMLKAGLPQSFETGLAAYLGACAVATDHLSMGRDVVIDAVNGVEPARQMWRELAREIHSERFTVEVVCSDPVAHRKRVETRAAPTPPLPPPTWEEVVHREYHPWNEPLLTVDTVHPAEENLRRIMEYVSQELPARGGSAPPGGARESTTGLPRTQPPRKG